MTVDTKLTFYHAPQTRSTGVRLLLEELGAPYEMVVLDLMADNERRRDFLEINPMGKVPAIVDRGQVVTEQVAIYIYLADRFDAAGLAPAVDDPLRGPYLRWLAYYGSCFEPAVLDKWGKYQPENVRASPYGNFDSMMATLLRQLADGPWVLGDRFTAADLLWGSGLGWTTNFGLVPLEPPIAALIDRVKARPAFERTMALEAALVAAKAAS